MDMVSIKMILVLALATATVAITVTKASLFEDIRAKVNAKNKWLGKLIECPYCFSHWVAGILVVIYRPVIIQSGFVVVDLIVTWLMLVSLAMMGGWLTYRAYKTLDSFDRMENEYLRADVAKLQSGLKIARQKLSEQAGTIKELEEELQAFRPN